MATLCLDASLKMLWPLCCHLKLHLQRDLCCCLQKEFPQDLQAVVTLFPCHVLQNIPVYCPGIWGMHYLKANSWCWWRPESSSTDIPELSWPFGQELNPAGRPIPDQWRRSCYDVSQLLVAHPLDTLGHQFHPQMGHFPPKHDVGRVMAFLQTRNVFLHPKGHLSKNLIVLVVVLILDGEDFIVRDEMFSCPSSVCHWRRQFALVHRITFKAGIKMCPSCVGCLWWGMTLIGSISSALGTWSSVSRVDFSKSTLALFW